MQEYNEERNRYIKKSYEWWFKNVHYSINDKSHDENGTVVKDL